MPKKAYLLLGSVLLATGLFFIYKDQFQLESAAETFAISTSDYSANTFDHNISSRLIENEFFNSIKRLKKSGIEFKIFYYEDELTFPKYAIVCEKEKHSSVLTVGYGNDNSYFHTKLLTGKWSPPSRSQNIKQLKETPQSLSFPHHGI